MKKIIWGSLLLILAAAAAFVTGVYFERKNEPRTVGITLEDEVIPALSTPKPKPLEKFSLANLNFDQASASPIKLIKLAANEPEFWSVVFTFEPEGKLMSGLMNIPKEGVPAGTLVMLRGWAPGAGYTSGTGTKNGSFYYAREGNYLTAAPDFFGYGESDPEPEDSWQARFEKPLLVMDLIKSLEAGEVTCTEDKKATVDLAEVCQAENLAKIKTAPDKVGLWGHSNGGQIALSVLELMQLPIPTTLWAAVTAPFPYSVLFFTDEEDDEGKSMRKWLAMFEEDYDVFDFTVTKHLDKIAPETQFQLHHGTADEAALYSWAMEFADKVEAENKSRNKDKKFAFTLYKYPGADHNLKPGWETVVKRDLDFFNQNFGAKTATAAADSLYGTD